MNKLIPDPKSFVKIYRTAGSVDAAQLAYLQGAPWNLTVGNYTTVAGDSIDGTVDATGGTVLTDVLLNPDGSPACFQAAHTAAAGDTSTITRVDSTTVTHSAGGVDTDLFSPDATFMFSDFDSANINNGSIGSVGTAGTYYDPYTASAGFTNNTTRNMRINITAEYETAATVTAGTATTLGLQMTSTYLGLTDTNVGGTGVGSQDWTAGTHKIRDYQDISNVIIAPGETIDAMVRPVMFLNSGTAHFQSINYNVRIQGVII